MAVASQSFPNSIAHRRWSLASLIVATSVVVAFLWPHAAHAQTYAIGQRAECDATGRHKYYQPGTVIAPHPGETFNGHPAGSGYFYRMRMDGGDPDGTLCKAEDTRPVQAAAPTAAAAAPRATAAPVAAAPAGQAAPGAQGNKFGTRAPRTCAPVKTQPNLDQIKMLLQCQREGQTADRITLIEHISVQAGATRPYNYNADSFNSTINPAAPVLPIRGSLDLYQCNTVSKPTGGSVYDTDNTGKNCLVVPQHKASGECYRTTFGDWKCNMMEATDPSLFMMNQPPPR